MPMTGLHNWHQFLVEFFVYGNLDTVHPIDTRISVNDSFLEHDIIRELLRIR